MREARQHAAQSLLVRRGAKGEACGLVLRRRGGRVGRVLREPDKNQPRRRNVAVDRQLEHPANDRFELGDRLDRLAPLDLYEARGLLGENFIGGRLAFLTAGRIAALAGLELGLRGRPAIADVVLPGRFAGVGLGHQTSPSRKRWPSRVAKVSPVSSR